MMKVYIRSAIFLAAVSLAGSISFYEVIAEEWEAWKADHGKNYSHPMVEKFRMKIFMENKAKIARHNWKALGGAKSYFVKMNHYGDLLHHEFISMMNGFDHAAHKQLRATGETEAITYLPPAFVTIPKQVDWRKHGAVTPVKDQGHCGSCWAFSATGSLEGQHFRKSGKLVSLSEQNLVDCSTSFGNHGCHGGLMDQAFKYIKANGGIDTEESYPYKAEDDRCHFNPRSVGANEKGYVDITPGSEEDLAMAVATVGPISVGIDASHETFQFYSHGVYNEPGCDASALDHGVLVVGYGTEDGKDYWLVKNSWGEKWGLDGYIKMSRNMHNQCGVASTASYPVV